MTVPDSPPLRLGGGASLLLPFVPLPVSEAAGGWVDVCLRSERTRVLILVAVVNERKKDGIAVGMVLRIIESLQKIFITGTHYINSVYY